MLQYYTLRLGIQDHSASPLDPPNGPALAIYTTSTLITLTDNDTLAVAGAV